MHLRLIREPSAGGATLGSLYIDGVWQCWTLEDEIRETKVYGQTAIPPGRYELRLTTSPRFARILPEVMAVPNFVGVRIHAGNRKEDTEGCILVGRQRGEAWIGDSRLALESLMSRLVEGGTLSLTIENPPEAR